MQNQNNFNALRDGRPFPLLSTLPVDGNGRFHQQAHQRCRQVPFVRILRHVVEMVDGEQTVCGEQNPNEDGARDGEAFAAHGTIRRNKTTAIPKR